MTAIATTTLHACRIRAWISVPLLALSAGACFAVGEGSGTVTGSLNVTECAFNPNDPSTPVPFVIPVYDLGANFFVGQPVDSSSPTVMSPRFLANQMIIRIQNSGKRLEFADALLFWVLDSYEAVRCMRGRMNPDMSPDWDMAMCERSVPGPDGEGRLLIGLEGEWVTSSFVLNQQCPQGRIAADALGSCTLGTCPVLCPGRGSWIVFSHFGAPPSDLTVPVKPDFKVSDGDEIQASSFHVELCDDATVGAQQEHLVPIPRPVISGSLDGNFDFRLDRGQAGQPFP